jgi:hypothetical protein
MSDLRLPERRRMPAQRRAARRDHLVRELRAPRRRRLPFGGRALVLLPIGAALAGGAFAASQIWQSSSPTDAARVQCYEQASIEAQHREASRDIVGLRGPRQRAVAATTMCAGLWRHGVLGNGGGAPPPPLVACIYRGQVAVFPGSAGTCAALDMRPVRGYTRRQAEGVAALDRIAAVLQECGDPKEISRRVDALVRELGADPPHWQIGLARGRDCGPALTRRQALQIAMFSPMRGDSFMPPAFMGCKESYGGIAKAPPGTNCALGLGEPGAPDCPDGAQARRLVQRTLDRNGLGDWHIMVIPPESFSSRYCYVYSRVYPERDEVRLRSMVDDPNR